MCACVCLLCYHNNSQNIHTWTSTWTVSILLTAPQLMTNYSSFVLSEHVNAYITPATINVDLNYACIEVRSGDPVQEQANSTSSCLTISSYMWKIYLQKPWSNWSGRTLDLGNNVNDYIYSREEHWQTLHREECMQRQENWAAAAFSFSHALTQLARNLNGTEKKLIFGACTFWIPDCFRRRQCSFTCLATQIFLLSSFSSIKSSLA